MKKKETTTANVATFTHKLGKEECPDGYEFDELQQKCVPIIKEGLIDKISQRLKQAIKNQTISVMGSNTIKMGDLEINVRATDNKIEVSTSIKKHQYADVTDFVKSNLENDNVNKIVSIIKRQSYVYEELDSIQPFSTKIEPNDDFQESNGDLSIIKPNIPISIQIGEEDMASGWKLLYVVFSSESDKDGIKDWAETFFKDKQYAIKSIAIYDEEPVIVANIEVQKKTGLGEAFTAGAVAGTDTRFGGPSFEPVYFDNKDPKNNAIRNEKVFYNRDNKPVLPQGWVYASDLDNVRTMTKISDLRFTDDEIETPELDDEGVDMKKKTGIDWSISSKSYKEMLQRLRREHNI